MYGGGMYGGGMMPGMFGGYTPPAPSVPTTGATLGTAQPTGAGAGAADLTGQYLAAGAGGALGGPRSPRIIPNPFDNTLLIQGTRQEYESIVKLLRDIDVAPRQVLIEAKIYEVNLSGAFASGVAATLQQRSTPGARQFAAELAQGAVNLTTGMLVGQARELLAVVSLRATHQQARVISAPSVIATDSVPASINVGIDVPTLTASAVTGAQQGGTSLFANSIQNRQTGVTLQISARVNPSGIVTMIIGQEVSAPTPPPAGADVGIQSPSFSKRQVQTQVTVQDGDTIAIAGIINESNGHSSAGFPLLHRIPILGAIFGSRSYSRERTELIIFLTPRVIFDQNDILDATEELKSNLKRLSKYVRE
jgi:general secretion pathway protein D